MHVDQCHALPRLELTTIGPLLCPVHGRLEYHRASHRLLPMLAKKLLERRGHDPHSMNAFSLGCITVTSPGAIDPHEGAPWFFLSHRDLVAETRPARRTAARKQLDLRSFSQRFDEVVDLWLWSS